MKIVLLAYEIDATSIMALGLSLRKEGHDVYFMNCDQYNTIQMDELLSKLFLSFGIEKEKVFNISDEIEEINSCREEDSITVDYDYLKKVDASFVNDRNLNQLIATEPFIYQANHFRDVCYFPQNKEIVYKYAEILSKKIERILDEIKPDLIFTFNTQYFVKNLFYELACVRKIKTLALIRARIDKYYLLTENFGIGTEEKILNEIKRLQVEGVENTEAQKFVKNYKELFGSAYTYFREDIEKSLTDGTNWKKQILLAIKFLPVFLKRSFSFRRYRGLFNDNYFNSPNPFVVTAKSIRNSLRVREFFTKKELNQIPDLRKDYIYLPMHIIPESNVFTQPYKMSEEELVNQLAQAAPFGYRVYVKPNVEMFFKTQDTQPIDWYLRLSKIPNVDIISPYYPGKKLLESAKAVVGLSGTSLLEAAILNKPSFRVSDPEFSAVEGVYEFNQRDFAKKLKQHNVNNSNVEFYIQAIMNLGLSIDLEKYIYFSEKEIEREDYQKFIEQIKQKILAV